MNWKRILFFDLRRLLPGLGPTVERRPEDLWFMRARRRPQPRINYTAAVTVESFVPCQYYRMLVGGSHWRGPHFDTLSHWRQTLAHVLNQAAAIARANTSFVKGFEVAACEEHRLNLRTKSRRLKNIAKASVPSLAIAATLFAASIRVLERMDVAAVLTFLVIVILAAIPGWYMLLRNERLEALLLVLRDRMAGGATLSEAMRSLPRVFPRFLCDYVAAGEQSGQLAKALDSLGEESVRTLSQQRYIRLQFIYLFSVFFVIVAIMMFLTVKVLPVFLEIANEFSMDVPAISRAMGTMNYYLDDMGSPLRETGFQMLAGAAAIGAMLLLWRFRRSLRAQPLTTRYAGSLMLLVPWLRGLFQQQNLALASFMLEKLLRVGVPLDQALDTVAQAGVHPFYRKAFDRTRVAVVNGESLPDALDRERALLPGSFRGLVRVGERAGMLPDALLRLHDHYQREVMKRTRMLVDVLVPIGVILLGMLTLSVELGLFLLLTTLADNLAMPV